MRGGTPAGGGTKGQGRQGPRSPARRSWAARRTVGRPRTTQGGLGAVVRDQSRNFLPPVYRLGRREPLLLYLFPCSFSLKDPCTSCMLNYINTNARVSGPRYAKMGGFRALGTQVSGPRYALEVSSARYALEVSSAGYALPQRRLHLSCELVARADLQVPHLARAATLRACDLFFLALYEAGVELEACSPVER